MTEPLELNISFQHQGFDYDAKFRSISPNKWCLYEVLGDKEKLETAYKILSSVSLDSISSTEDLIDKLSVCKDISFPSIKKTGTLRDKTLDTQALSLTPTNEVKPNKLEGSGQKRKHDELVSSHEIVAFDHKNKKALSEKQEKGAQSSLVATMEVATHNFLERRVGSSVLSSAHQVVNSLNKNIIYVAPVNVELTRKLEEEFVSVLPSFDTVKQELTTMKLVLNEKIGIQDFHLREFSEGGSGAKVFGVFVPAEKGQLTYVIKTMEGRTSELARELSSLQLLSDLNLRQSVLPTAQTAGKFNLESKEAIFTIFVQTAAKGKPFSSLMEELGKAEGPDREQKIKELSIGLTRAARGLAELHLKNQDKAMPLGNDAQTFNLETLQEVYGLLKKDLSTEGRVPITKDQLEKIHNELTESVVNNWGLSGYSHGDTHLENLFFDTNTDQFTFIDTPSFLASIDAEGQPIGFPAYDFAWTMGSISDKGFRAGLSEQEVEVLQNMFMSEYESIMGKALAPMPALKLAALTKKCYFIWRANQNQEFLLDNKDKIPDMKEQYQCLQRLIDYELKSLKKLL